MRNLLPLSILIAITSLVGCTSDRGVMVDTAVRNDSQKFLILGMQVDAMSDDEWHSTEDDTLWNYHKDIRVRLLLREDIQEREIATVTVISVRDGKELYIERKKAMEHTNGSLIFHIPNEAFNCIPFTVTAEMGDQNVTHSLTPSNGGCGE
jgi:hypothetical protein